jgi:hypothetical protein
MSITTFFDDSMFVSVQSLTCLRPNFHLAFLLADLRVKRDYNFEIQPMLCSQVKYAWCLILAPCAGLDFYIFLFSESIDLCSVDSSGPIRSSTGSLWSNPAPVTRAHIPLSAPAGLWWGLDVDSEESNNDVLDLVGTSGLKSSDASINLELVRALNGEVLSVREIRAAESAVESPGASSDLSRRMGKRADLVRYKLYKFVVYQLTFLHFCIFTLHFLKS